MGLFSFLKNISIFTQKKKMDKFLEDYAVIVKRTEKAITPEQCHAAMVEIVELNQRWDNGYTKVLCSGLIQYLIDTREHDDKKYHKPEWNGWKTVRTYPDLRNYIGEDLYVAIREFIARKGI